MHISFGILCCAMFACCAYAQDDAVLSLKGLTGVSVVIDPLDSEATDIGLTIDALRTDAELRLRRTGVKVLNINDLGAASGFPMLHVDVTVSCITTGNVSGMCAYALVLKFRQFVTPTRDKQALPVMATTWELGTLGTGGRLKAANGVKEGFANLTDRFLNDYLTVNPK